MHLLTAYVTAYVTVYAHTNYFYLPPLLLPMFLFSQVPMDRDVDMEQLARGTPGFSGAELFNLINQAALKASVDNLNKVDT